SPLSALGASLLSTLICNESGASPARLSAAETVATWCHAPLGGHSTQSPSGIPAMTGRVLSMFKVSVCGDSPLPTKSVAKKVTVVDPSSEIDLVSASPLTTPAGSACAPANEKCKSRTAPPELSVAVRVSVTVELFQRLAGGAGATSAT